MPAPIPKELLPPPPPKPEEVAFEELVFRLAEPVPPKPPLEVLLRLCTEELVRLPVLLGPTEVDDDDDDDCLVAFEDLRCFDDDDDDDAGAKFVVVILMLVADVEEAVALIVESISFSGDEPESEDVS